MTQIRRSMVAGQQRDVLFEEYSLERCERPMQGDSVLAMCNDAGLDAAVLNPDAAIAIAFVGGRVR